jgi:amino acid transporter
MSENSFQHRLAFVAVAAMVALVAVLFSGNTPDPHNLLAERQYFEVRRLYFAVGVLAALFLLLILAMLAAVERNAGAAAQAVFDAFVKVVPPIMTLVLGFYFGQSGQAEVQRAPAQDLQTAPGAATGAPSRPVLEPSGTGTRPAAGGNRRVSAPGSQPQAPA